MKRILVIHQGSLGDFLLLLPSLAALRRQNPDARIDMLGRPEILGLVCPGIIDSIASIDRATLAPFFYDSDELPEAEVEYFSSFNTVLALISDPQNIFQRNLEQLGIRDIIVQSPFPDPQSRTHVSHHLFEAVRPLLGAERVFAESTPLRFGEEEIRSARMTLQPAISEKRTLVAIHPGSGGEKKCWPPENFEAVARNLAEEGHASLLILGPADERLVGHMTTLGTELGCPVVNSPPLRKLAALLMKCDGYVGNDSGVTHLAAATGIPTIAIFGPTDPAVWAPTGSHVKAIMHKIECNPCSREEMQGCKSRRCLEKISVEKVTNVILETLAKTKSSPEDVE